MSSMPELMLAARTVGTGGPESLVVQPHTLPTLGANQALIRVAAAGLNRADLLQRRGQYPPPPGAPEILGLEVAGTVVAVAEDASRYRIGDRVCALLEGGGYAQYCAVDVGQVLPIPGRLSMAEAASLPEAYFTAWSNVFGFGQLKTDESLLVHGGASGVGVAAIQLAKQAGHRVYATAGSEEKCTFCESLGADRAIDYRRQDFVDEIAALTNGCGVDVVLDMVGGSYLARNTRVLATAGRLVIIAVQGGAKGEVDILRMMQHRLVITGSTLRARSSEFKAAIAAQLEHEAWPFIAAGRIKPVVDRIFPLEHVAEAHRYMEQGVHKGKIVLHVAQEKVGDA